MRHVSAGQSIYLVEVLYLLMSEATDELKLASALHCVERIASFTTLHTVTVVGRACTAYTPRFGSGRPAFYSTDRRSTRPEDNTTESSESIVSRVQELLFGGKEEPRAKPASTESTSETGYEATWEPVIGTYAPRETPTERWRRKYVLGSRTGEADESRTNNSVRTKSNDGSAAIAFRDHHRKLLSPTPNEYQLEYRDLDYVKGAHPNMRSFAQILTTPTADTPGTTLLLHFDSKRYLVGSLAEGTQRASVQMGARLLKVSECFITGRTEWRNTGGLIGMILTLADAAASSSSANNEQAKKSALAKGKRLGVLDDVQKMRELEEEAKKNSSNKLTLFSPPNLNHTLATARRFVFRKGMPVDVHEIDDSSDRQEGEDEWMPYWADENIKVWAMSIKPDAGADSKVNGSTNGKSSPRKRSIDEVYERGTVPDGRSTVTASSLTAKERDQLTVKAVVGEMFNSSWRLDTLHEMPLSQVNLPATIFIRNAQTNKIERYSGPLPNGAQTLPDPDLTVLVRKPWPGALVESLPDTTPAKEAISYIIRNHMQRGKFNKERAISLNIAMGRKWAELSSGNNVLNEDGETITPDMVLGESKEGGGMAVVDLPDASYITGLLARAEWRTSKVMTGVGAIMWNCGPGVANDQRIQDFMHEFAHIQHIVSSPEHCPNNIALDSAAAATVRQQQVDPSRYVVPVHDNDTASTPLLEGVHRATRGQVIQLEPTIEVHTKQAVPPLDIAVTEAETSPEVLAEAATAQQAVKAAEAQTHAWANTLPPGAADAEIVTLGTGSALPSKYRNVSATLLRVPGWGSILFDCGENTLGQLKRVFPPTELKQILHELRIILISHMHADHHLGTVSVIKAWYDEVHNATPLPTSSSPANFDTKTGLAVISEPAMQHWLHEYSSIEDYGFSRLAPLYISTSPSQLGWFIPPATLASMNPSERRTILTDNHLEPSFLNLADIQAVAVKHCHGARAMSLTFPSGFKASYSGDCRPSKNFSNIGKGSTVCIHEATFDDELQGDAQAKNHSTTSEALGVAQAMGARTCVLTHFSQRYQKLPVLERAGPEGGHVMDDVPMARDEGDDETNLEDEPMEADPAEEGTSATPTTSGGASAVKLKLASDMKVCVAFDYMRVKVGQIPELEHFTPALLKLFAEEEKPEVMDVDDGGKKGKQQKQKGGQGGGKGQGKGKKGQRGNA